MPGRPLKRQHQGDTRVTIVWDRDDVLNDLTRCWLEEWWKPAHPTCKACYADLTENPPHRVLGVSLEEYLASLDEFRLCDQAAEMDPVPEVSAWFKQYGHLHRHMVLTATSLDTAPAAPLRANTKTKHIKKHNFLNILLLLL